MAGDGNFKWFWAESEDAERWHGNEDSREAAISAARAEFGRDEFWICECDRAVATANINGEAFAEQIMEALVESNEECFDEDFDGDAWPGNEPLRALAKDLEKVIADWLVRFPAKTWCFGDTRAYEKIPALMDA